MSATNTVALNYGQYSFNAVQMGGQLWLRATEICVPLGVSWRSIQRLFQNNADEFTPDESRLVPLPTTGGVQQTRVYSMHGAWKIGALANTRDAKRFRLWLVAFAQGKVGRRRLEQTELALVGTHRLPTETVRALNEAIGIMEPDDPARHRLVELRDGVRPLAEDPFIEQLASRLLAAGSKMGEANREIGAIIREGERAGYTRDGIKAAARRIRGR